MPRWPPHTALSICWLHYKELQTLQEPNILFPNTQPGPMSSVVPPGPRDLGKAGTGSWFCSNLGHKETPSPCLSPGPQAQGDFGAASPDGYTAGSQGNAEGREEKLHKALKCTFLLWEWGGGHSSLLTFSPGWQGH